MPTRTCVGCRRSDDQTAMWRIAASGESPVLSRTAPGRGAWLHAGCGALALRRRAIPRALRMPTIDPAALAALVEVVDAQAPNLVKPRGAP